MCQADKMHKQKSLWQLYYHLEKQGQSGAFGYRHFRLIQGFFQCRFRHGLQAPHLGAKHPVHFLQRFHILWPLLTFAIIIPRAFGAELGCCFIRLHLHTNFWFWSFSLFLTFSGASLGIRKYGCYFVIFNKDTFSHV